MRRMVYASLIAGLACSGAVALAPAEASACGGFFCDGGPQPMPVDQTGEDILFIADGETVEVHIRVEYEGEAEKFAWVIPTLSIPTDFAVGSESLIDNIKAASVPQYGITTQPDDCSLPSPEGDPSSGADDGAGETGGTGADTDGGGPTIYKQEVVGAFEITVLGDGTVEEVMTWLAENGYQQDPAAEPILAEYLAEDHYFAAIKLNGDAGVDELHPIALKFDHSEPCVPLRLTRIAASEDMDVRTYFLGDNRVVPDNYRHVLVNPLKIDWTNQASNYKEVITRAVDADEANGRAFVTEYAGPSDIVARFGLVDPNWDSGAFVGMDPTNVPDQLMLQGLLQCGWDSNTGDDLCTGINPMVDAVLADFLPVPEGVDPTDFYQNTAVYSELIDLEAWDGQGFADLLEERVLEPGRHADELLTRNEYLTRMYTTISPHEMIEDPMFYDNPDLGEVDNLRTATNRILCSGDSVWILPDGREVFVPAGETWPDIGGDKWFEEEVQETMKQGPELVLVDNTEAIDAALEEYNKSVGWEMPSIPGEGEGDTDTGGNGSDSAGAEAGDGPSAGQGCGCSAGRGRTGAAGSLAVLLGLILVRRRR